MKVPGHILFSVLLSALSCTRTEQDVTGPLTGTAESMTAAECEMFRGGDGSAENPFQIASAADLVTFQVLQENDAGYRSRHYRLIADIDMGGVANYTPVGADPESRFTGVLDGDGHVIRNLTVRCASRAALFGCLGGKVKNIDFAQADIKAATGDCAAVVAAVLEGESARIEGCRTDAGCRVSTVGNSAGSIVGLLRSGVVDACASHASVTAGTYCAGGIVGFVQTTDPSQNALVINCVYSPVYKDGHPCGAVLQAGNANAFIGGISGSLSCRDGKGTVRVVNCFAYPLEMKVMQAAGSVVQRIGGITGYAGTNGTTGAIEIRNCLTPVTYSNVIVGGTRLNARTSGRSPQTASVIGAIPHDGVVLDRLFSTNTWNKCCYLPSGVAVSASGINAGLGDTNLRGWGTVTVGSVTWSQEAGGMAAALNEGADAWNAAHTAGEAVRWAYAPTFGYPLPSGVDAPGTVTRKVSLLGDSISTYQGFVFSDTGYTMNKWYPDTGSLYDGQILNEQDTWWWKLIYEKMSDARLDASNSFSGSTVCYLADRPEQQVTANCFQRRASLYGLGDPDILFYYGGRNDFGSFGNSSDIHLGSYTEASLEAAWKGTSGVFFDNYSQGSVGILRDFHARHPKAKVLLIVHDQMSDGYAIAALAVTDFLVGKGLDIRCVNLHETGTKNTTNTEIGITKEGGTHPNAEGAANIVNYIWAHTGSWLEQ